MWHYRGGTRVFSHSTGAVSLEHMRSSQKFTLECTGRKAAGSGKGTGCKLLIAVQFLLVGQLNPSNKEASVPCHIGRITWKVTSPQGTASLCPGSQSSSVPAASSVAAGKGYQTPNLSVCLSRMSVPAPKLNTWTRAPTGLKHFKCVSSECCYVTFAGRYTHTNTSEITFLSAWAHHSQPQMQPLGPKATCPYLAPSLCREEMHEVTSSVFQTPLLKTHQCFHHNNHHDSRTHFSKTAC